MPRSKHSYHFASLYLLLMIIVLMFSTMSVLFWLGFVTSLHLFRTNCFFRCGGINKIIETDFNSININNNLKKILRTSRKREEKVEESREKRTSENKRNQELKETKIAQEDQKENSGREERIEYRWMTNIDYQHSIEKYKNCKDCRIEKEILEEIEINVKKLNMLSHEVLLL